MYFYYSANVVLLMKIQLAQYFEFHFTCTCIGHRYFEFHTVCMCMYMYWSHFSETVTVCKIKIFSEIFTVHTSTILHVHCKTKRLKNMPYQDKTFTHGYDVSLNKNEQFYCVHLFVHCGTELQIHDVLQLATFARQLSKLYLIVQ